jgi:fermentation-respiration switch protein FrsA (DUF1100 family)
VKSPTETGEIAYFLSSTKGSAATPRLKSPMSNPIQNPKSKIENDPAPESSRFRRILRHLFVYVGIPYLAICAFMTIFQRDLMYVARRDSNLSAAEIDPQNPRFSDLEIQTHDGLTLHGWLLRADPAIANDMTVICFPGNAGHRGHRFGDCREFAQVGFNVVMVDYRGYGDNPGKPNETDIVQDAWSVWKHLTRDQRLAPETIILFGESLGGGVAVQLAARACRAGESPGGLVVSSTFSSMTEAAQSNYPYLPVSLLILDRYPSADHIADVDCPIKILHGDADTIVPFELGQNLFTSAPEKSKTGIPKSFVRLEGYGHNNVPRNVLGEAVGSLITEQHAPRESQVE